MSYGLEVKSEKDSSVIVSENVPTMLFAGKGSNSSVDTITSGTSYRYYNTSPVIPVSTMPVCFIAQASGQDTHTAFIYSIGGGQWNVQVWQKTSSAPVDVYWFYNPIGLTASSDTWGLRLYDSSGGLIYDAGWGKTASIDQVVPISNSNGATATMAALTKPAIMHFNSYGKVESYPTYGSYFFRWLKWVSTTLTMTDRTWFYFAPWNLPPLGTFQGGSGGTIATPIINASLYD